VPTSKPISAEPLLTAQQVAKRLRVSKARVYELTRQRKIPVIHLGRTVRYDPTEIDAFLRNGGTRSPSVSGGQP
jgi:excisionase family DNA binding protein